MNPNNRVFTPGVVSLILMLCFHSTGFAANRPVQGSTYSANTSSASTTAQPVKRATRTYYKANYKGAIRSYKGEPLPAKPIVTPPPPIVLKEGPYVGLGVGYDSYKVDETIPLVGTSTNATTDAAINGTGLIGQLVGGYGHYFNSVLYLGGEIFGNISAVYQNTNITITDTTDNISYNAKFIVTTGYGFSILPGVKLSDSGLVFLRLGYHVARLRGQENRIINGTNIVNSTSSWSGGFGYGLGFEEAMVENFSLRGEYTHIDYRTFNASTSSMTQYSPSDNQFMLSLIYHITL